MLFFVVTLGQQPHITGCDTVPTLAANFPNLTRLSLAFPCVPGNIVKFLGTSHFPSLRSFTLSIGAATWSQPPHDLEHASTFAAFISRHSHTLTDLHLPNWTFEEDIAPAFASLVLGLRHLHSCFHMAVLVAQSPSFAETIRTLRISRCSHQPPQDGVTPAWVKSTVRLPYANTSARRPDDINSLPGLVRMLHNFTSTVSTVSRLVQSQRHSHCAAWDVAPLAYADQRFPGHIVELPRASSHHSIFCRRCRDELYSCMGCKVRYGWRHQTPTNLGLCAYLYTSEGL